MLREHPVIISDSLTTTIIMINIMINIVLQRILHILLIHVWHLA